jgi:uncharacterized protein YebE (UPF0316 family)
MTALDAIFAGPWGVVAIFLMRIVDVSLSTVRILLAVRGKKLIVPFIGFGEVLVWVFAAGTAIRHLESPLHVLGYALGFSTGTVVGLWLEEKLAIGIATMRIVTSHVDAGLAERLRELGCGVTEFGAQGRMGPVEVVFTVVPRRQIPPVLRAVEEWDPAAFITIEEPREIRRGWMHSSPRLRTPSMLRVGEFARQVARKDLDTGTRPPG